MADPDKRTDIDKLLAEVETSLSGRPQAQPPARTGGSRAAQARPEGSWRTRMASRTRSAAVAGAVAAVAVWILFAMLPFIDAWSGAMGAFLAAFGSVLLVRRR